MQKYENVTPHHHFFLIVSFKTSDLPGIVIVFIHIGTD
jgi:hypothetical protein